MRRYWVVLALSLSVVAGGVSALPEAAVAATGVPAVPVVLSVVPSSSGVVVGVRVPSSGGVASSVSVVSSPGGVTASTGSVSAAGDAFVSVSGLSVGTGYSFTASASNGSGSSGVSAASAVVTPNTGDGGGDFVPVGPVRSYNFRDAGSSALGAGETRNIAVAGVAGVPSSGVSAVALAVSVVNPSAAGFVTVWPAGAPRPQATTVNFSAGLTKTDLTKVPLGAGGQVSIYNYAGTTGFTFDVVGFYEDSSGTFTHNVSFAPIAPYRVFDSRPGHGGINGEQGGSGPLAAGSVTQVQVVGGAAAADGVPAGASAVEVNVEAVNPASAGYGTLWAHGSPQPRVSNILYGAGAAGTIVTSAITPVGADGAISVFVNTTTDVVIDISGYYAPGAAGRFVPITPTRASDSRCGAGNPLGAGASRTITVAGGPAGDSTSPVPATATAVVFAATAVDNTTASYLTFWPGGQPQPHAANLLPGAPGALTDNLVVTGLGANAFSAYNNTGATDVITDINGYYQPAGDPTPTPAAAVGCPRALTATPAPTSITLSWRNPAAVTGYTLVRKPGPTPPASPTDGTVLTTTLPGTTTSYTDTGLTPATQYSYALYATGPTNNYSQPGTITATTPVWVATRVPLPAGVIGASALTVNSVACGAPDSCVAVGTVTVPTSADTSGEEGLLVARSPGEGWTSSQAPLPADATGASLAAVACSGAAWCTAVGTYHDATDRSHALIETLANGQWTDQAAPLPPDAESTGSMFFSLTCAAVGACVATGAYTTAAGQELLLESLSGTTWTAAEGTSPPSLTPDWRRGYYMRPACDAPGSCVVSLDYLDSSSKQYPWLQTLFDGTWTPRAVPLPADAASSGAGSLINGVACDAPGSCVLGGDYLTSGNLQYALLVELANGTWTPTKAPLPADAAANGAVADIWSVACGKPDACEAGGEYDFGTGLTRTGLLEDYAAGTWTALKAPLPSDADTQQPAAEISNVACGGGGCVAYGTYSNGTPRAGSVADYRSSGSWLSSAPTLPPDAGSTSVAGPGPDSCAAPDACALFGRYVDRAGQTAPVLEYGG